MSTASGALRGGAVHPTSQGCPPTSRRVVTAVISAAPINQRELRANTRC